MEYQVIKRNERVKLEARLLPGEKRRGAVLIIPGGGFNHLSQREGEPVAWKFAEMGYHTFVLSYRLCQGEPLGDQPLEDACWAMSMIRRGGSRFRVDPRQVFVCGFSAGGYLAAGLATANLRRLEASLKLPEDSCRPTGAVLCYPVITAGKFAHKGSIRALAGDRLDQDLIHKFSLEEHVTGKACPVFLWHTAADTSVPVQNSMLLMQALLERQIPVEAHIFPWGSHGLSLANPVTEQITPDCSRKADPHVARWIDLCGEWMSCLCRRQEEAAASARSTTSRRLF